jgi:hypothetical protein
MVRRRLTWSKRLTWRWRLTWSKRLKWRWRLMWSRRLTWSRRMMVRRRVQDRGRPAVGQLQVSWILFLFILIFV